MRKLIALSLILFHQTAKTLSGTPVTTPKVGQISASYKSNYDYNLKIKTEKNIKNILDLYESNYVEVLSADLSHLSAQCMFLFVFVLVFFYIFCAECTLLL